MARVDLRCVSCGYMFFVNDVQLAKPGGVKCPSCLAPVGLSGPAEGPSKRAPGRVLAAGKDSGDSKAKLAILAAGGAVVIGIAVVIWMFAGGSQPRPDDDVIGRPAPPAPASGSAKPLVVEKKKAPPPPPKAPPKTVNVPAPPPPKMSAAPPAAPAGPAAAELPADLVGTLRSDLLSLKDWHLNLALSAPEKTRLDALLAAGKGLAGDVDFLRGLVTGPRLMVVREEARMISESTLRFEKEALESLPVDRVTMNDGRVLQGKVVEETKDMVKLERKFAGGVAGIMPLARPGIKELAKGKGLGSEFKTRWDDAKKGGPAKLVGLLTWCKENTLPLQATLVAYTLLGENPGLSEARAEVGFASDPVSRMLEAEKQGGFITHEGRRWVPAELRDKLLRDGFVLMDGKWVSKKDRIISVPGLFRYETQNDKPVQIVGTLAHDELLTYTTVQDLTTNTFQEKPEIKLARRFYAAIPLTVTPVRTNAPSTPEVETMVVTDRANPAQGQVAKGEVFITVPVGAPILEASVMTLAEVKGGSSIAVSLILDGNRTPVYSCASKEDKTRKLPELIRGKTEVALVAEITSRADYKQKNSKRRVRGLKKDGNAVLQKALDIQYNQLVPDYGAVLFPSNSNTIEVFRLTVATADPSPALDKLFENAPDVLKEPEKK